MYKFSFYVCMNRSQQMVVLFCSVMEVACPAQLLLNHWKEYILQNFESNTCYLYKSTLSSLCLYQAKVVDFCNLLFRSTFLVRHISLKHTY